MNKKVTLEFDEYEVENILKTLKYITGLGRSSIDTAFYNASDKKMKQLGFTIRSIKRQLDKIDVKVDSNCHLTSR